MYSKLIVKIVSTLNKTRKGNDKRVGYIIQELTSMCLDNKGPWFCIGANQNNDQTVPRIICGLWSSICVSGFMFPGVSSSQLQAVNRLPVSVLYL